MNKGFTLIELVISLAIVAVLFGAAVMGIGSLTGTKARAAAGELAGTIRSLYDTSSLSGNTCRLVFEMPTGKEKSSFQYWAECAQGNVTTGLNRDDTLRLDTLSRSDELKRASAGLKSRIPSMQDVFAQEKDRAESQAKFAAFTSEEIKARKLSGVSMSVWTKHQHESVDEGLAYLYFFPQGYTERAQLYVRQGANVWTITVSPLTGKTAVVGGELQVPRS